MASIKRSSSRRKFNRDRIDIDDLMNASSFSGIRDVIESHFSKPDTAAMDSGDLATGAFVVETDPARLQYAWEPQQVPVSVRFAAEVIERLERQSLEIFRAITSRGSEIGAILLGQVAPSRPPLTVIVEDYEPFVCSYSRGPSYLLSDQEREGLRAAVARRKAAWGLSVVGFFRSNTRAALAMPDEDLSLFDEIFPEGHCIFAMAKPFSRKPCQGAVFVREGTFVKHDSSYLEFPFSKAELETAGSLIPAIRLIRQSEATAAAVALDRVTIIRAAAVSSEPERPDQVSLAAAAPKLVVTTVAMAPPAETTPPQPVPVMKAQAIAPPVVDPKAAPASLAKLAVPPVVETRPPLAAGPQAGAAPALDSRVAPAPVTPLLIAAPPKIEVKVAVPLVETKVAPAAPGPEPAPETAAAPKVRWTPKFASNSGPLFPAKTVPATLAAPVTPDAQAKQPAEAKAEASTEASAGPKAEAWAESTAKPNVPVAAAPPLVSAPPKAAPLVQAQPPKFDPAPSRTAVKIEPPKTEAKEQPKTEPVVKPAVQLAPKQEKSVEPKPEAAPVAPVESAKPVPDLETLFARTAAPAPPVRKTAAPVEATSNFKFGVESQPKAKPAWLLPAIGGALLVVAVGILAMRHTPSHSAAPAAPPPVVAAAPVTHQAPIALSTEGTSRGLVVRWDGAALQVTSASRGWIAMSDGNVHTKYTLTPADLKSGSYTYKPRSDDVTVQLELEHAGNSQNDLGMIRILDAKRMIKAAAPVPPPAHKKRK